MKRTIATVRSVTGTCNAGYRAGDRIVVDRETACIDKRRSGPLCIFALNAILNSLCRIAPGRAAFASCPDPATGLGGNVVFDVVEEDDAS